MKKIFIVLFAATMALAFAACTEKEIITPGSDNDTTQVEPPTPRHNELYETSWSGTGLYTVTVPIFGDVNLTVNSTIHFETDSTANSYFQAVTALATLDTNLSCAYTYANGNGTLNALDNADLHLAFTRKNDTTLNITVWKADLATMWPNLATVFNYLPQDNFSIDLYKQ